MNFYKAPQKFKRESMQSETDHDSALKDKFASEKNKKGIKGEKEDGKDDKKEKADEPIP